MKARNRPPRLDDAPRAVEKSAAAAPAPTPTELLVRARIAGKSAKPNGAAATPPACQIQLTMTIPFS